jgi:hypothetical protein
VETDAFPRCESLAGQSVPAHLATGAVIAVAHLADIVRHSDDPWFQGPWGWLLDDVVPICPVQCPGQRQLFTLPDDVEQAVRHAMRPRAEA